MSLYRRGRIWWIEFEVKGRRFRESSGATERKKAQEFEAKRKAQAWREVKLGEPPAPTWGEAVKKWLTLKPRGLPDKYRLRSLDINLHTHLPLSSMETESALGNGTAGSFNRSLALVVAIHNAAGVEPPDVKRKPMPPGREGYLGRGQWLKLLAAIETESPLLAQCARFAIATGLRENNVLNLRWDQVNLTRAVAFVGASETKQRTSIGIPLTQDAVAVLRERRGLDKVWVFAHPESGKPLYKASNRAWYTATRKAGLSGFRWHDLRHTFAAWAVQSGVSLQELMGLGGWKTYSMVLRYAHLSAEHLRGAAAKIRPAKHGSPTNSPHRGRLAQR